MNTSTLSSLLADAKIRLSTIVAVISVLTGCATPLDPNQVRVTFNSQPPGAMIYTGATARGVAPVDLVLTANESDMRAGYSERRDVFAVWPSGAKSPARVRIFLGRGSQQFTFSRPSDTPGLDKDLSYAAQLEQRARAEAARDAQYWRQVSCALGNTAMCDNPPRYTNCTPGYGGSVNCVTR